MTTPAYEFTPAHQRGDSKLPLLGNSDGLPLPVSPSSRASASKASAFLSAVRYRRLLFIGLAVLSAFSLAVLSSVTVLGSTPGTEFVHTELAAQTTASAEDPAIAPAVSTPVSEPDAPNIPDVYEEEYEYSPYVLGPPTQRFRDNLRNDTKYITSWISAGWSMSQYLFAVLVLD